MKRLLLVALAAVVVLVGCSGDEGDLGDDVDRRRGNFKSDDGVGQTAGPATTAEPTPPSTPQPRDPRASWSEAIDAWNDLSHSEAVIAGPDTLNGLPVAAVSTSLSTDIWIWNGEEWSVTKEIQHSGDPIANLTGVEFVDVTGDALPELIVSYTVPPFSAVEVFTPIYDEFVPLVVDTGTLTYSIDQPIGWMLDGQGIIYSFITCEGVCAEMSVRFGWDGSSLSPLSITCNEYIEIMPYDYHLMSVCHKGPLVGDVQRALNGRGFPSGPSDGFFGPTTHDAVRSFQRSRGLDVTGSLHWTEVNDLISGRL